MSWLFRKTSTPVEPDPPFTPTTQTTPIKPSAGDEVQDPVSHIVNEYADEFQQLCVLKSAHLSRNPHLAKVELKEIHKTAEDVMSALDLAATKIRRSLKKLDNSVVSQMNHISRDITGKFLSHSVRIHIDFIICRHHRHVQEAQN